MTNMLTPYHGGLCFSRLRTSAQITTGKVWESTGLDQDQATAFSCPCHNCKQLITGPVSDLEVQLD